MFVGDARPSGGDEWVYHDFDILKEVVLPAVRIALKLHQVSFLPYCSCITHTRMHARTHSCMHTPHTQNCTLTNKTNPTWIVPCLKGSMLYI